MIIFQQSITKHAYDNIVVFRNGIFKVRNLHQQQQEQNLKRCELLLAAIRNRLLKREIISAATMKKDVSFSQQELGMEFEKKNDGNSRQQQLGLKCETI